MFYNVTEAILSLLTKMGLHGAFAKLTTVLIVLLGFVLLGIILYYISKIIITSAVRLSQKRRYTLWGKELLDKKFFNYVSALIPGFIIQKLVPQFLHTGGHAEALFSALLNIYIIINITLLITSFLKALTDVLLQRESTKDKPIKSYVQVVNIIVWGISIIVLISILINKSPAGLLAGLGAFSAVLLLVFQDTIIGFVNSIQLSSNDLLRNGDWITMSKYGVDGDVEEINLISVKVRNFDKTISTIPVKQLVSDSFQNWRAIQDLNIRRIKRSINVDVTSIKPCTPEMLERFKQVAIIKDYVIQKEEELKEYNKAIEADTSLMPNGRHQTNVGVLRYYIQAYLKNHPDISDKATLMVRQLAPNEYGLPLEIYCFTATSEWMKYEAIQGDVFDHIYSVLDFFEIRAFQRDAGKK